MSSHRARCLPLLLALLLPLPGCLVAAAAAVGAGVYGAISYDRNEAQMDVQQDLETTFAAAEAALKSLAFPVEPGQKPGKTDGTLLAGEAKVVVERHPGDVTRVRARVGTFDTDDNRRRAKLILEAIRQQL